MKLDAALTSRRVRLEECGVVHILRKHAIVALCGVAVRHGHPASRAQFNQNACLGCAGMFVERFSLMPHTPTWRDRM